MSVLSLPLEYEGKLWPASEGVFRNGPYEVHLGWNGVVLRVDFELPEKTKAELVEAILSQNPKVTPSLQGIPVQLHRDIFALESLVRVGARRVDEMLRWAGGAIRLPTYALRKYPMNTTPSWPTVCWNFDEADKASLAGHLSQPYLGMLASTNGVAIPLPYAQESRFVELHEEQIHAFGQTFESDEDVPLSSFSLFAIAWENFERQAYSSAVIILTACLETAVKWQLHRFGDEVASYLLENVQSPPLDKLVSCARKHAQLEVPKRFQKWCGELIRFRNGLVHRPDPVDVETLQIAQWFAVGEAVLRAIRGWEVEPLAGAYVQAHPNISDLPPETKGVVLRREVDHGESTLHVLMDSGLTGRFHNNAVIELDGQKPT